MKIHGRAARRTVRALTLGRRYTDQGIRGENRAGSAVGKADCGAITSAAATLTEEPVTCRRCRTSPRAGLNG
ncbi:hypothetical protein [Nocardia paucivorans]|uniref:hypothetical protein n=1 Tax=Nocardia paucivorans TaxID=114259 RepID=UPI0002E4DA4F|nr:hypothetical protein [Nocardia paucivorans]